MLTEREGERMAGKRGTAEQVEHRRHVVEAAMIAGEWSLRVQSQLAERFGISTAQIRKDAAWVRRQWAEQESEISLEDRHAMWRQLLDATYRTATKEGHTVTVARLLAMEARVEGFEAPQRIELEAKVEVEKRPELAAVELLQAVPMLCEMLGIETPDLRLPVIEATEA